MENTSEKHINHIHFNIGINIEIISIEQELPEHEKLNAAVVHQLRFVEELMKNLSLTSSFAVMSLLADTDEGINEYQFDQISMLESFSFLSEFACKVLHNAKLQIQTGRYDL